MFMRKCGKIY